MERSSVVAKANSQAWAKRVDPDVLGYLLSGFLCHHQHPNKWRDEVLCLVTDDEPYKSMEELEVHCDSLVQLSAVLPFAIIPSCTAEACRTLVNAGSHNAFGIRSGSEDGEEYMGYGVYPSASYFNHSCTPSILKGRVGSVWEFRAAHDIEEGEEWNFECMCKRCIREAESCPSQSLLSFGQS